MSSTHSDSPADPLDVVIVGGGIAGLVVAYRLARLVGGRHLDVRLLERQDRWGGLAHSHRHDPWLFESGPDSMVTAKPAGLALCEELGLGDEIVAPASTATFSLVREGKLHRLPQGFRMIAPTRTAPLLRSGLFSPSGKLRLLRERFVAPPAPGQADESVESFVTRRFGREAYERIAEPVLGGLFVADASKLSARRTLGPLLALEAKHGSVARGLLGPRRLLETRGAPSAAEPLQKTLRFGIGSLVDKLRQAVPNEWLQRGCEVTRVQAPAQRNGRWTIDSSSGRFETRALVVSCPSPQARALVEPSLPLLGAALAELEFVSCATVNLVYRKTDLPRLPEDFGFFAPASESLDVLAATYSSLKFEGRAPEDDLVIRTFHGGALDASAVDLDDAVLIERAHRCLETVLGITGQPVHGQVFRARDSMPQFGVGHLDRVAALGQRVGDVPNLHLAGSALGHYGIPDCVASAEEVAAQLIGATNR